MRLRHLHEAVKDRPPIRATEPLEISWIDPEEDWEQAGAVEMIAKKVEIRSVRSKDVTLIARVGEDIIGGIFSEIYTEANPEDPDMEERVCDFDAVVDPDWQGYQGVGLKLIGAAIENARAEDCTLISLFVVNIRLQGVLRDKFGFEGEDYQRPCRMYLRL